MKININIFKNKYLLFILTMIIYLVYILKIDFNYLSNGYKITVLLPICYFVCLFIFLWDSLIKQKTPFITMFILIAFIRYVLLSIITIEAGDYKGISSISPTSYNLSFAAFLMIWELLTTSLFIKYWSKKNDLYLNRNRNLKTNANILVYIIFILFSIGLIILIPDARNGISFFGEINKSNNDEIGSLLILVVRELFINSKYFLLMTIIIILGGKSLKNLRNKSFLKYIFIFIVGILIIGIRIGTNRKKMIADALAVMLMIRIIFPKYKKITTISIIIVSIFLFTITTVFRGMTTSMGSIWSDYLDLNTLQIYFLGQYNVAVAIEAHNSYSDLLDLSTYMFSFLRPLFGIGSLVKNIEFTRAAELFNIRLSWGLNTIRHDQILPLIGEGYMLFGGFFAPILSIIIARIGILCDKIFIKSNKIETFFISTFLAFYLAQGMILNATIILNIISFSLSIYLTFVFLGEKIRK